MNYQSSDHLKSFKMENYLVTKENFKKKMLSKFYIYGLILKK